LTNSVLITGATGLIGNQLTDRLLQKGCRVSHLGRSARKGLTPSFQWNPRSGTLDAKAFDGVDTVIHLAGAGIADKRWSPARKREIMDSRIQSTTLLYDYLASNQHQVRTVICASAIGYYGFSLEDTLLHEDSPAGKDFLSTVVLKWEEAMDRMNALGLRMVKIRIGIVLSKEGGALKELARPVAWGVGAPLGTGRQMVSWIHMDDLCALVIHAIQNEGMQGPYNATAPNPVTNRNLTKSIARAMGRHIILPPIPHFIMRIIVGEMADLVLFGSSVSCQKVQEAGFTFKYPELPEALKNLLSE
jgi:uncharacterized protein (TIGR01777 family)